MRAGLAAQDSIVHIRAARGKVLPWQQEDRLRRTGRTGTMLACLACAGQTARCSTSDRAQTSFRSRLARPGQASGVPGCRPRHSPLCTTCESLCEQRRTSMYLYGGLCSSCGCVSGTHSTCPLSILPRGTWSGRTLRWPGRPDAPRASRAHEHWPAGGPSSSDATAPAPTPCLCFARRLFFVDRRTASAPARREAGAVAGAGALGTKQPLRPPETACSRAFPGGGPLNGARLFFFFFFVLGRIRTSASRGI